MDTGDNPEDNEKLQDVHANSSQVESLHSKKTSDVEEVEIADANANDKTTGREKCSFLKFLCRNLLAILIVLGVIGGIGGGILLKHNARKGYWTSRRASYIGFPGEIFISMLKCMVVPLVTCSIIAAIGSVDMRTGKFIAARGISFYMCTTIIAVILGIFLVQSIRPGERGERPEQFCQTQRTLNSESGRGMDFKEWARHFGFDGHKDFQSIRVNNSDSMIIGIDRGAKCRPSSNKRCTLTEDTLLDLIRSVFPPNIFQATIEQIQTEPDLNKPNNHGDTAYTNCDTYHKVKDKKGLDEFGIKVKFTRGTNIIGLIVLAIAIGIAAVVAGPVGTAVLMFFISLSEVILIITNWIIWTSPLGVMSLVAAQVLMRDNLLDLVKTLGFYSLTVLLGLLIHCMIILPLFYTLITRKLPFKFYGYMGPALSTAFGTSSSSATIPVTIHCLEKNAGIDSRIVRFLIPIGATINLDGTALYEAVAAMYIAQLHNMEFSFADTILVSVTATIASIGAAGIPSAGIVTMVLVLNSIGLPAELVTYIIPVDWFLDRFRTVTNVFGDSIGAAIVHHISQARLKTSIDKGKEPNEAKETQQNVEVDSSRSVAGLVDEANVKASGDP